MKRFWLAVILVTLAALVAACEGQITIIRPSGTTTEQRVEVGDFSAVDLRGVGSVNITPGESTSVTITADDNIMSVLRAEVDDNTLVLGVESNTTFSSPPTIIFDVVATSLDRLAVSGAGNLNATVIEGDSMRVELSGAGDIRIDDLIVDTLNVRLSGAGSITIESGRVTEQIVDSSGVGSYNARNLDSTIADIDLSGAGNAVVFASETLRGSVSGVGSISYAGDPTVDVDVSSAVGSVDRFDR